MYLVTGNLFWINNTKIPNKYSYLSQDIECEVVIVGGGITGAITAYNFTMSGVDTVLVDKNIIGYGSTSASTSILQYEIDYDLIGLKGLRGLESAVKAFKLTKKAVYDIKDMVKELDDDCDFSLTDCLYYSSSQSDVNMLKKEYEIRKKHGFDVELLDEESSKGKFSFPVKAGIYSREGAGYIDPYRFSHALIRKAVNNGLRVFENTEIVNIESKDDHVLLTTHNQFKIRAKKVIIATGFQGKDYIDKKTAILSRSFTIVTKPVSSFEGWFNKCIIRDTESSYTYLRTTGDNRIIIGGEDLDVGGNRSKISTIANHDYISREKYEILLQKLKSLFPKIKDIEVEYRFNGLFGESQDGLPYVGEYNKLPNYYFNLGYGSNGILYAVLGAKLLTDIYFNRASEMKELFKIER